MSSNINAIAEVLSNEIVIGEDTISFKDTAFASAMQKSGIDEDTYKKVRKFEIDVAAGAATVFGMAANNLAAQSENIETLATKMKFGDDRSSIELSWRRETEVNSAVPKAGEAATKKTKFGTMRVKVNRADEDDAIRFVRNAVSDDASQRFTKASVAAVMA